MIHPVHFLDGRCELLETSPDCLAGEAVALLARQMGLEDPQGWALYEVNTYFAGLTDGAGGPTGLGAI